MTTREMLTGVRATLGGSVTPTKGGGACLTLKTETMTLTLQADEYQPASPRITAVGWEATLRLDLGTFGGAVCRYRWTTEQEAHDACRQVAATAARAWGMGFTMAMMDPPKLTATAAKRLVDLVVAEVEAGRVSAPKPSIDPKVVALADAGWRKDVRARAEALVSASGAEFIAAIRADDAAQRRKAGIDAAAAVLATLPGVVRA